MWPRLFVVRVSQTALLSTERISTLEFTPLHGKEDRYSSLKIETPNQQHNGEDVVHLARRTRSTKKGQGSEAIMPAQHSQMRSRSFDVTASSKPNSKDPAQANNHTLNRSLTAVP